MKNVMSFLSISNAIVVISEDDYKVPTWLGAWYNCFEFWHFYEGKNSAVLRRKGKLWSSGGEMYTSRLSVNTKFKTFQKDIFILQEGMFPLKASL